jgi:hypothetical protein
MAHGHQDGLYKFLTEFLPKILDRPVARLVFWVCGGDRDHYPFTAPHRLKPFHEICSIVRPRETCPCRCHHEDCHAWNADQNNGGNGKCPVGAKAETKVLSAGYYLTSAGAFPSALNIDPAQPDPFGAPGGMLIELTITRDGQNAKISPKEVNGQTVLGTPVRDTAKPSPSGLSFDPKATIREAKVPPHEGKDPTYAGPRADVSGCTNKDGCIRGRSAVP